MGPSVEGPAIQRGGLGGDQGGAAGDGGETGEVGRKSYLDVEK